MKLDKSKLFGWRKGTNANSAAGGAVKAGAVKEGAVKIGATKTGVVKPVI